MVDNKILNKYIRTSFNNIRKAESLITKRRLLFIGKVIRILFKKISTRLISAFLYKKIPRRKPNNTIRYSILDDIKKNIPSVDKYGDIKNWAYIANNELLRVMLENI